MERTYFCIDMKSFYASVECAERGLNPMSTALVVADKTRGKGALCLAVSPKMKSLGVRNRCRLSEIPAGVEYIVAPPRMRKYIECAADIYEIYLDYFSKDDIHVYSIDEDFIDATDYLKKYAMTPTQLVGRLIGEIAEKLHIPATAGIGSNLYLAKIALDITAKHAPSHIGMLDEQTYKDTLWDHRPITDFWQVASGTAARLAKLGIYDMRGVANASPNLLYATFGVNAELLIDHANGRESCTIADIKAYKSRSKSVSNMQILFSDYPMDKARLVLTEMTLDCCQRLMREHLITGRVGIMVGYSDDVIAPTGGSAKMVETTAVFSVIKRYVLDIFDKTTRPDAPIRRLGVWYGDVCDEACEGYDLFTDTEAIEKEKRAEAAVIEIKNRFGKNAMLRAMDFSDGATMRTRNKLIGGHNSGE